MAVLLIRGCVCVCPLEASYIRPQPCLEREAEGSAAAGSDAGSLGNVVPPLFSFLFVYFF